MYVRRVFAERPSSDRGEKFDFGRWVRDVWMYLHTVDSVLVNPPLTAWSWKGRSVASLLRRRKSFSRGILRVCAACIRRMKAVGVFLSPESLLSGSVCCVITLKSQSSTCVSLGPRIVVAEQYCRPGASCPVRSSVRVVTFTPWPQ